MNELVNLLKQLAELDPDLCKVTEWTVYLPTAYYKCLITDLADPEVQDRLQGVLQWAIAARGWYFDVAYVPLRKTDDKYHAAVQVIGGELQSAKSDTPATALLSAYVRALAAGGS